MGTSRELLRLAPSAGNQDMWHYHVHVTPRYHNDNFYGSERVLMPPAERVQLANELREALEAI